jgi:hypothetical protein
MAGAFGFEKEHHSRKARSATLFLSLSFWTWPSRGDRTGPPGLPPHDHLARPDPRF